MKTILSFIIILCTIPAFGQYMSYEDVNSMVDRQISNLEFYRAEKLMESYFSIYNYKDGEEELLSKYAFVNGAQGNFDEALQSYKILLSSEDPEIKEDAYWQSIKIYILTESYNQIALLIENYGESYDEKRNKSLKALSLYKAEEYEAAADEILAIFYESSGKIKELYADFLLKIYQKLEDADKVYSLSNALLKEKQLYFYSRDKYKKLIFDIIFERAEYDILEKELMKEIKAKKSTETFLDYYSLLGKVYEKTLRPGKASDAYKKIFSYYSEYMHSYHAAIRYLELNKNEWENNGEFFSDIELYYITYVMYKYGSIREGRKWFARYSAQASEVKDLNILIKKIAEIYYKKGNYKKVIELAKPLVEVFTSKELMYETCLLLGRAYSRYGMEDEAIKYYKLIVEKIPRHKKIADVYWKIGWYYENKGIYKNAINYYEKIYKYHKKSKMAHEALFRCGLLEYEQGNTLSATKLFEKGTLLYKNSPYGAEFYYWLGKLNAETGNEEKTFFYFNELNKNNQFSYYSAKVKDSSFDKPEFADMTFYYPFKSDSGLREIEDIFYLGFKSASSKLFEKYVASHRKDKDKLFAALSYSIGSFNLYNNIRVANKVRWNHTGGKFLPDTLVRLLYPIGFSSHLNRYSSLNGLKANVVHSLIRQESWYHPTIKSSADAYGLMQIIPPTGKDIASDLKVKDYSLTDPETNIRFGTYYLKTLLDKFDGNMIKALASYNAGPHRIESWNLNKFEDPDVLIEKIRFKETRNYVKRILAGEYLYDKIKREAN